MKKLYILGIILLFVLMLFHIMKLNTNDEGKNPIPEAITCSEIKKLKVNTQDFELNLIFSIRDEFKGIKPTNYIQDYLVVIEVDGLNMKKDFKYNVYEPLSIDYSFEVKDLTNEQKTNYYQLLEDKSVSFTLYFFDLNNTNSDSLFTIQLGSDLHET